MTTHIYNPDVAIKLEHCNVYIVKDDAGTEIRASDIDDDFDDEKTEESDAEQRDFEERSNFSNAANRCDESIWRRKKPRKTNANQFAQ